MWEGADKYFGWLLWQLSMGGLGLAALCIALILALVATVRHRAGALGLVLVALPVIPLIAATIGRGLSSDPYRTGDWVVVVSYGCLAAWLVALVTGLRLAHGAKSWLAGCGALTVIPTLLGAMLGAMSGSGDWL